MKEDREVKIWFHWVDEGAKLLLSHPVSHES
jgi:hypothetical protein